MLRFLDSRIQNTKDLKLWKVQEGKKQELMTRDFISSAPLWPIWFVGASVLEQTL